jgi:hypothetical protein
LTAQVVNGRTKARQWKLEECSQQPAQADSAQLEAGTRVQTESARISRIHLSRVGCVWRKDNVNWIWPHKMCNAASRGSSPVVLESLNLPSLGLLLVGSAESVGTMCAACRHSALTVESCTWLAPSGFGSTHQISPTAGGPRSPHTSLPQSVNTSSEHHHHQTAVVPPAAVRPQVQFMAACCECIAPWTPWMQPAGTSVAADKRKRRKRSENRQAKTPCRAPAR